MSAAVPQPARLRASDQDRHEAVLALSDHYAAGRLDLEEFTARMERAQEATYVDDLDPLFVDLPHRAGVAVAAGPRRQRVRPWFPVALVAVVVLAVLAITHGRFPWLLLPLFWFVSMRWRHVPAPPGLASADPRPPAVERARVPPRVRRCRRGGRRRRRGPARCTPSRSAARPGRRSRP